MGPRASAAPPTGSSGPAHSLSATCRDAPAGGRRPGANASTRDLTEVARHVENLTYRYAAGVGRLDAWNQLRTQHAILADAVADAIRSENWQVSRFHEHATRSALLPALDYTAARNQVRNLRNLGVNQIVELLTLSGYINSRGNRAWNYERATELLATLAGDSDASG